MRVADRCHGKRSIWFPALVCCIGLPSIAAGQTSVSKFAMTLESNAVLLEGVAPKTRVALLGVTREMAEDDFPVVRFYREWLEDEDGDGTVRFESKEPFPKRTVFLAVDGSTGAVRATTSASFGLRATPWKGAGVLDGAIGEIQDQRSAALVLLVRPGTGAWAGVAADGREEDEDGEVDGQFALAVDKLEALADSDVAPLSFLPTDVIVLIDPTTLEFTVSRVDGAPLP